ncbi:MAG: SRPBCC family protein [Candidatus Dormiibacterota bacterium]
MNEAQIVNVINRPAEAVFAALADLDRYPDWNSHLTQVRKTSDGPLGVGSTMVFIGKLLGRNFESDAVCTEYVANETLANKTTAGPFYIEVGYTLEPIESGTRFTTALRGESKGFFRVGERVALGVAKKQFEAATENLKALMEADSE